MEMTFNQWQPIQDLPALWQPLASSELSNLSALWQEQSSRLQQSQSLKEFNERLQREWAIETGVIENLYSIDRGVTQLLIERGIEASLIPHGATDKPVEVVIPLLRDQQEAVEGLFDFVSQKQDLSTSYIKQLHQVFTRHQETVRAVNGLGRLAEVQLLRGEWKKWPNNPTSPDGTVYQYCPPEQVASEMDRLLQMHHQHVIDNIPPEVEAAWLHHRFTQIHPFQDGNGRIARALASLIFIRAKWFPLVIHRDIRVEYISALESADAGTLATLVQLFVKVQKKAFLNALSISQDVLKEHETIQQVISAATDRLRARQSAQAQDVFAISKKLEQVATTHFKDVANTLNHELSQIKRRYSASVDTSDATTQHWFKNQIIDIAKGFGYYADTRTYAAWVRLKIREERQAEIVVSFHSVGAEFVGVMVASAFVEYRDKDEDDVRLDGPYPVCDEVFQFSSRDGAESANERFDAWIHGVILVGVDQWRRQL
jgi:Fic family protein